MGEAKRRGTYEERRKQAINEGRLKTAYRRKLIFRKFDTVFNPPKEKRRLVLFDPNATSLDLAVHGIHRPIKQPGENRKEHKPELG